MVTHEVRKKMPLLKAIELTVDNLEEAAKFVGGEYDEKLKRVIVTGNIVARPGHYLVQAGTSGKWFVHTKESLDKNFEVWSPKHKHTHPLGVEEGSSVEVSEFPKQKENPRVAEHDIGRRFVPSELE